MVLFSFVVQILQSRYSDDIGFNYIQFLEDLQVRGSGIF